MDWKEQFYKQFTDCVDAENDYYDSQFTEGRPCRVEDFIRTKIIEKLIEDIPDYQSTSPVYLREKEQLRAKWLGKETL
jgi:hypothetical protein